MRPWPFRIVRAQSLDEVERDLERAAADGWRTCLFLLTPTGGFLTVLRRPRAEGGKLLPARPRS